MTYFSLLTRMQKKASRQKVFRMISSAPDLKHILQKLNILGQRQIIQPVPVVSDCLGHFVPIYCAPWEVNWLRLQVFFYLLTQGANNLRPYADSSELSYS